ncbi:MAG: ATP-binding protein [Pontiellaceae bacterium]
MEADALHIDSWKNVKNSFSNGHIAHAYLLEGSPSKEGFDFSVGMLQLLFCDAGEKPNNTCSCCQSIRSQKHIDTLWLEPSSKSRQIVVADVESLINRMQKTSFSGGWKAAVILYADRLQPMAQHKLLKILEEPPARSILILVSENVGGLLPTIKSRCQRIKCGGSKKSFDINIESLFSIFPPQSGMEAIIATNQITEFLSAAAECHSDKLTLDQSQDDDSLSKEVLEARLAAYRKQDQYMIVEQLLYWVRDILAVQMEMAPSSLLFPSYYERLAELGARYHQDELLLMLQGIEHLSHRMSTALPERQVLEDAFREMIV